MEINGESKFERHPNFCARCIGGIKLLGVPALPFKSI